MNCRIDLYRENETGKTFFDIQLPWFSIPRIEPSHCALIMKHGITIEELKSSKFELTKDKYPIFIEVRQRDTPKRIGKDLVKFIFTKNLGIIRLRTVENPLSRLTFSGSYVWKEKLGRDLRDELLKGLCFKEGSIITAKEIFCLRWIVVNHPDIDFVV